MQFGNGVLDITAIALSVWIAYRRGGLVMALAIGAALAVLMRAYGAFLLTLPWNPYLPVMWWFVFLLAVWSVFCDDFAMLPIAVLAGTFCMQTHISYLGLIAGVLVFVAIVLAVFMIRRKDPVRRRSIIGWSLGSFALLVVLWIPPVIEQFVHNPGNLTTIKDHFSNPPESPIGFVTGLKVLLTELNPAKVFGAVLVRDGSTQAVEGAVWPGVLLLLAWAGSVVAAAWTRVRALIALDVVLGVAIVLGYISAARIFGDVWFYLVLWAVALTVLMIVAIGWTIVAVANRLQLARRYTFAGVAVLLAIALLATGFLTADASDVTVMSPRLNAQLAALTPPTVGTLKQMERNGQRGPYLVTWLPEAQAIGAEGYGLLNELLRYDIDAKADEVFRPGATRYHVIDRAKTTLQVHLATGPDIERWRRDPRFHEVAYYDPKSAAERADFDRLHQQVVAELQGEGLTDLIPQVEDNLFMLALLPRIPEPTRMKMSKMLSYGLPAAVFVGPVADPATP
jgi:hypothetical protein